MIMRYRYLYKQTDGTLKVSHAYDSYLKFRDHVKSVIDSSFKPVGFEENDCKGIERYLCDIRRKS